MSGRQTRTACAGAAPWLWQVRPIRAALSRSGPSAAVFLREQALDSDCLGAAVAGLEIDGGATPGAPTATVAASRTEWRSAARHAAERHSMRVVAGRRADMVEYPQLGIDRAAADSEPGVSATASTQRAERARQQASLRPAEAWFRRGVRVAVELAGVASGGVA